MKVLLIAFEYPPLNTGGAHRPFRQARALPAHGITPIVVTPSIEGHGVSLGDSSMDRGEDGGPLVVRTPLDPPRPWHRYHDRYYFNLVDTCANRWRSHLFAATDRLVKEHRFDLVMVTAPPFSMAGLGIEVARRHGLPLALDLRDAWSNWVVAPYASRIHYRMLLRHERRCLQAAATVMVTSQQTLLDLEQLHPMLPPGRIRLVTNGYDGPIPAVPPAIELRRPTPQAPLTIGYVGGFYFDPYQRGLHFRPWWRKLPHQYLQYAPHREDWSYRSPQYFLRALATLRRTRPEVGQLLRAIFVGKIPAWLPPMIEAHGVQDMVEIRGPLPHQEALAFQKQCDLLLITSAKRVDGRDYSIAGKTFEYVAQVKPILAFTCPGAQQDILAATGLMVHCPPDELDASLTTLARLLDGGLQLRPDREVIASLHINNTTAQLARVLRDTVRQVKRM